MGLGEMDRQTASRPGGTDRVGGKMDDLSENINKKIVCIKKIRNVEYNSTKYEMRNTLEEINIRLHETED